MRRTARRAAKPKTGALFPAADYAALETLFAAKPDVVLAFFASAQIACLAELDTYARLKRFDPVRAQVICLVAFTMGIPEELDNG